MTQSQPEGYLAAPSAGDGPSGAVLVLHAWWGLNDTIKGLCDRLAAAGFVAFAPDLYHGPVTDTIAGAEALSGALDADGARADVVAAIDYLHERAGRPAGGLAVIGFSLGAWFAMEASAADPRVRAVVIFYGSAPLDFSASQAAYLIHFAENDPYEPREYLDETLANLASAGRPATLHEYPGTGHWFFEPDRADAYDAAAAELAWERTLAFLRESVA
jgi:carboxymethylenebutenolidase